MDLTIHQNCPSCGAGIELHEADRLIRCPYCEVQNFMITSGVFRFTLPDKAPAHIDRRSMFYAPYLRFKGNVYYCKGKFQKFKVVDTTQQGMDTAILPPSLGLRPQAMPISLVSSDIKGVFLRQTIKAQVLLERAALLTVIDSENIEAPFYHRAYIGETLSCIYLPLYVADGVLYDAVTNKVMASGGSSERMMAQGVRYRETWTPRFLATLCPHCGDALSGEHDSLVLLCHNCHSSWEERRGSFSSIDWEKVSSIDSNVYYLPFWKLQVRSPENGLESFGDLLRVTNQPRVVMAKHTEMELEIWVPAFKLRPSTFLRLGKTVTLSQERIPPGDSVMVGRMHPVTLQRKEAVQAIKSFVAAVALNKRKLLPLLPEMYFHPVATTLSYLPFADQGHDFVQEQTGISVAKSVLRFGRKL